MNDRIERNLLGAITTMRDACDDAERRVKRLQRDGDRVAAVVHALSWGFANASSSIESAIDSLADDRP